MWKNALWKRMWFKERPSTFSTVGMARILHQITLKSWQKTQGSNAIPHWSLWAELSRHLDKYIPHSISKLFSHCIKQIRFKKRGRYFNRYHTSVSEIADSFPVEKIFNYICNYSEFEKNHWPGRVKDHLGLILQWCSPCTTSLSAA